MQDAKCAICGKHVPIPNDTLCQNCSDRHSRLLRAQLAKTGEFNAKVSRATQSTPERADPKENAASGQQIARALEPIPRAHESEQETGQALSESQLLRRQMRATSLVGYFLLASGMIALVASIAFAYTIAAFAGLGLTFWGLLAFFIQPKKYLKSDLMNATAISSIRTIDKMMLGMGYREKGVYIRTGDSDNTVVFIPSEPFSMIPEISNAEDKIFLSKQEGLLVPPPGLSLASLIETKLGFKLKNCGVQALIEALPKVLVEDLKIVHDVEIEVTKDDVRFKLYDSIYSDFCSAVRETSKRFGLGCPICSALASILTIATSEAVLYDDYTTPEDQKVTQSVYHLISGRRL